MMPRGDVQLLDMSVDMALKYIVSMGVVAPAVPGETAVDADAMAAIQDHIEQELDVTLEPKQAGRADESRDRD